MKVPFVDLRLSHDEIASELRSAVDAVFSTSTFSGGPPVDAFESKFAEYCESPHCVAVGSGTAALEVLLRAYEIGVGDEVILPVNTFVATAEAVRLVGATPVFVDVHAHTANLDAAQLLAAASDKTRAIIPVHLYGQTAEMSPIVQFARQHELVVIEDASQAHGATYHGRRAGALADAAAFSFYPAKNLGAAGEAGALTTVDPQIAERARMIRNHGSSRKYHHERLGRNDRIDSIQASILNAKLVHLARWNAQRRAVADAYRELLANEPRIRMLQVADGCEHVYHLFVVRVKNRDQLQADLQSAGVATGIHYPIPLHQQPAYVDLPSSRDSFPVATALADEILSLPMFPQLEQSQIQYVIAKLLEFAD